MKKSFVLWAESPWARPVELALLALAYYLAARVSLQFAFQETNISPLWPPSGLAMALVLWRGARVWPAIALGAFAANLTNFLGLGNPLPAALLVSSLIAIGNTLECLLGGYLLQRSYRWSTKRWEHERPLRNQPAPPILATEDTLAHPEGVVRFAALAAALSSAIPATLGALSVHFMAIGKESNLMYLWWTWWTGDVAGILLVTPAIMAWKVRDETARAGWTQQRWLEALLLLLSTTLVSVWIFGVLPFPGATARSYLVMPFLIWASFRFGRIGACSILFWVGCIAAWGTARGLGPFAVRNSNESLLLLQTFMGVVAMTTLIFSAALAEQRSARKNLESQIKVRTAELVESHANLANSFEQLQKSENLRDNLMHMIVHDLRVPLSALQYAMRVLTTTEELSPRQQGAIDISNQSVYTLARMIANLLDIHQVESGSLILNRQTISPRALITNVVSQVEFLAHYKGLHLTHNVSSELPDLQADEEKLTRVLINLLDNAIRLTPTKGTISINVTLDSSRSRPEINLEGKPEYLLFSVADTGPGIPAEAFERIFEKFGHVNPHITQENSSSGLGLTFCKMIVQAHGGEIWVQSQLERGSTFSFCLPL